jgi:23S rRNA pseudouridine2605 synthase
MDSKNLTRLQKFIADCGVASRRAAEQMIAHGEVTVNGKVIKEMGFKVIAGKDSVKVRGKLLRVSNEHLYIILNKPSGVLTTLNDPQERTTVRDLLIGVKERVFPVGRLDYDSEGLIILTNDGEFAQCIIHPKKEIRKVYLIKVKGKPDSKAIEKLRKGVTLAEGRIKALHIEKTKSGTQYDWYKIILSEGRHGQVRRMFEKVGFDILKIKRVSIGKLTLGGLLQGQFKFITRDQAELALKD